MRRKPFGFSTNPRESTYSVGSLGGLMISIFVPPVPFCFQTLLQCGENHSWRIDHRGN